jgi:hypothetical protein
MGSPAGTPVNVGAGLQPGESENVVADLQIGPGFRAKAVSAADPKSAASQAA